MNILSWAASLHGIFVMLIAMIFSIFIAFKKVTYSNLNIFLFLIGMLTAYLDLLTTPIITYLLPMVIFNLFYDENVELKKCLVFILKTGAIWLLGYSMFWISKWIIVDFIYKNDIINTSFKQIIFRTNYSEKFNILTLKLYALVLNLLYSTNYASITIIILSIIIFFYNLYKYDKNYIFKSKNAMYCIYRIYYYCLVLDSCRTFISTLYFYI